MASARIVVGDALTALREMPSDSVHCCVTSPPYFGVRDYGGPETTWGGAQGCPHVWVPLGTRGRGVSAPAAASTLEGSTETQARGEVRVVDQGANCLACGAWRGQLGLEPTPDLYVAHLVEVFREVGRVLRPDGTFWLNLGDCYATTSTYAAPRTSAGEFGVKDGPPQPKAGVPPGLKPKDLVGTPWRVALALQADGWWLRSDIVWKKLAPMPESVTDRPTRAHEYVFLLTKSERYYYDWVAIAEPALYGDHRRNGTPDGATQAPGQLRQTGISERRTNGSPPRRTDKQRGHSRRHQGFNERWDAMERAEQCSGLRNKRDVWTIGPEGFPGAHYAVMPTELAKTCVLAGTSERGACGACGAPWERVVEKSSAGKVRSRAGGGLGTAARRESHGLAPVNGTFQEGVQRRTVGWEPTCGCGAEPAPCVVLDPFAGAGTTGLAADRLGRSFVGVELNPEYAAMAQRRIEEDAPLFNRSQAGA